MNKYRVLNRKEINDVFEWDVKNWSKSISFWQQHTNSLSGKKVLAVGENKGGLSLYFALQGCNVLCTDLNGVQDSAKEKHAKYNLAGLISYDSASVLNLPYKTASFDIVTFKSVLGALRTKEAQITAMRELHRVLKPGGLLLFAENLTASFIHRYFRKRFIKWAEYWRYLNWNELNEICSMFTTNTFYSAGFFGTFGRNEIQRRILSFLDLLFEKLIPAGYRYIVFGICKK